MLAVSTPIARCAERALPVSSSSTQGLNPILIPAQARINLPSGRRLRSCTNIPLAAARAQEGDTRLDDGILERISTGLNRGGIPKGLKV